MRASDITTSDFISGIFDEGKFIHHTKGQNLNKEIMEGVGIIRRIPVRAIVCTCDDKSLVWRIFPFNISGETDFDDIINRVIKWSKTLPENIVPRITTWSKNLNVYLKDIKDE